MIRDSGRIFAGTVIKIERLEPSPGSAIATTQITFRVEEAIRGVRQGHVVQVHEWAGLWLQIDRNRRVDLKSASAAGARTIELKTFAAALRRAAKE